jgi:gamma-glutamyl-gamma-aminobutyrate hydrolase PuuD
MIVVMYPNNKINQFRAIYKALKPSCKLVAVESAKEAYSINFDYLVLGGGVDIDPMFYGQERSHFTQKPDNGRDLIEWILIRRAMTGDIPTLGVCRGFQMMAVAHGAALYQDTSMVIPDSHINHRAANHRLIRVDDMLSAKLPTLIVNSRHHQTLKTRPQGFKVVAKSPDGLTEAIWRPGFLGIQWHPEDLYFEKDGRGWENLFQWHVDSFSA